MAEFSADHHDGAQIRAELQHHNIRVYPFDTEDADPEEVQLNEAIRVSNLFLDRRV